MTMFSGVGEEPAIYIHVVVHRKNEWAVLKLDNGMSRKGRICQCGAMGKLNPCFKHYDKCILQSSVAAVGSKIYMFGGVDMDTEKRDDTEEVIYIDTRSPEKGWTLCPSPMPEKRRETYAVTVDGDKVLVVGGSFSNRQNEKPSYAQLFNPSTDVWKPLDNRINKFPCLIDGHAVVEEGGKKMILMHSCDSPSLYYYDMDSDEWGIRWEEKFGKFKYCSVLVDGIYYILEFGGPDPPELPKLLFSGYDVSLEQPIRLEVDVSVVERCGWLPVPHRINQNANPFLLPLGNSKLAMIWTSICVANYHPSVSMMIVHFSIFKMVKERYKRGLKLTAIPVSKGSYHIEANCFEHCVTVQPLVNPRMEHEVAGFEGYTLLSCNSGNAALVSDVEMMESSSMASNVLPEEARKRKLDQSEDNEISELGDTSMADYEPGQIRQSA